MAKAEQSFVQQCGAVALQGSAIHYAALWGNGIAKHCHVRQWHGKARPRRATLRKAKAGYGIAWNGKAMAKQGRAEQRQAKAKHVFVQHRYG
jgi:hypothetical protein